MSIKEDLKNTGAGLVSVFSGLGRSIGLTLKTAADKINDDVPEKENAENAEQLKKSWVAVGRDIGGTGLCFGKVIVGTAKKLAGAAYNGLEKAEASINKATERSAAKKEEPDAAENEESAAEEETGNTEE